VCACSMADALDLSQASTAPDASKTSKRLSLSAPFLKNGWRFSHRTKPLRNTVSNINWVSIIVVFIVTQKGGDVYYLCADNTMLLSPAPQPGPP